MSAGLTGLGRSGQSSARLWSSGGVTKSRQVVSTIACPGCLVCWVFRYAQTPSISHPPQSVDLQLVWSARLTSNAIRRDFYDLTSEDYRYLQFRKLVPKWFFEIIHIIVIGLYPSSPFVPHADPQQSPSPSFSSPSACRCTLSSSLPRLRPARRSTSTISYSSSQVSLSSG